MTHASVAGSRLEVPEALVRLSVGIEGAADLIADLEQALDRSLIAPPLAAAVSRTRERDATPHDLRVRSGWRPVLGFG